MSGQIRPLFLKVSSILPWVLFPIVAVVGNPSSIIQLKIRIFFFLKGKFQIFLRNSLSSHVKNNYFPYLKKQK